MIDINLVREHPEVLDNALEKRGAAPLSAQVLALDKQKRELITITQQLQQQMNQAAKLIGQIKDKSSAEFSNARAGANKLKQELQQKEHELSSNHELEHLLATIPNIPASDVPVGGSEEDNVVIKEWGLPKQFSFTPKEHFELGEQLGLMDFAIAGQMSGSRFSVLKGDLVKLERALAAFMLDINRDEFGFTEISPPLLVRDQAMFGTGQLPKFAEDSFATDLNLRLIPTAEVPLVNLVAEQILLESELPLRYTAYTPCFRSEAGSAGKDTRGMLRQHQFYKVELVSITAKDQAENEHEHIVKAASTILERLELPYRQVLLCTGDMGFAAQKTIDFEVWLPGQQCYREISSCSNCGDFQARRMKARYRKAEGQPTEYVHTLNGSSLAVGRTLIAILENYQQEDGSIVIPKVLQSYMGYKELITASRN